MNDDYCLYPESCGKAKECLVCLHSRIAELEDEIKEWENWYWDHDAPETPPPISRRKQGDS